MARCKGCGAEIIWIETTGGKAIPCDPEHIIYWALPGAKGKVVTPNGEVVSCVFEGDTQTATGIGYISHWSTCRKAGQFRRKA